MIYGSNLASNMTHLNFSQIPNPNIFVISYHFAPIKVMLEFKLTSAKLLIEY